MSKVPITVVVITKNEEHNLDDCLKSVQGWADEMIVIDDDSTDKTVEVAQKYTDRVLHRSMDMEGRQRNWAYTQAKNEWIFSLDADERLTKELKEEIDATLASTDKDMFTVPRKNYLGSYWIRYGGLYPAAQLRLFKKGKVKYEEVQVHPLVYRYGEEGKLTKDMLHYSYKDVEHFLSKLNGQTTLEAKKWFETGRKMSFGRAFWRFLDRFPRSFLRKRGYKDGFVGFIIAFFASLYQMISYAKYWELKRTHSSA